MSSTFHLPWTQDYTTRKQNHTVEDLWSGVAVEDRVNYRSEKPIRPVIDNYQEIELAYQIPIDEDKLKDAWALYSRIRAERAARPPDYYFRPHFAKWVDRVRFSLHIALIRLKIVI